MRKLSGDRGKGLGARDWGLAERGGDGFLAALCRFYSRNRKGGARLTAVKLPTRPGLRRLCPSADGKASGFPAHAVPPVLLCAGWKAQPSSLRRGGCSGRTSFGKAKPFPSADGRSRKSSPAVTTALLTSVVADRRYIAIFPQLLGLWIQRRGLPPCPSRARGLRMALTPFSFVS